MAYSEKRLGGAISLGKKPTSHTTKPRGIPSRLLACRPEPNVESIWRCVSAIVNGGGLHLFEIESDVFTLIH